jgi:hypothetical protein
MVFFLFVLMIFVAWWCQSRMSESGHQIGHFYLRDTVLVGEYKRRRGTKVVISIRPRMNGQQLVIISTSIILPEGIQSGRDSYQRPGVAWQGHLRSHFRAVAS